jgi:hypothetical protein
VQPENLKFGGGAAGSVMHPAVMVALLIAILLILLMHKKNGIVPVLLIAFLVPLGQQIIIGGVHVLALRIVILVALIRSLFSKGKWFAGGFGTFDKVFSLWTFFHVITFLLLFSFAPAAVVNQFGFLWDALGGFLAMRFLIQDEEDVSRAIKTFAYIAAILAVCMLNERFRMQNIFGFLGGDVRIVPEMRDGLVRAQATFAHPLLAGTFGATILPLFFLLWRAGKSKAVAAMGMISATIMVVCASSSTPLLAYAAGIGAMCFWPFRKTMRLWRWGIVFVLLGMNMIMKAPVWFVIGHISLFGSSSSDHRAYLIDMFIRHFSDWWLVGTNSAGTWGWDMWDTSNQYVAEGESGGLAVFVCFIAMISICFSRIGKARKAVEGDRAKEWYFWVLGAALFSHAIGFFGISYFDQTRMSWYALLVMIVAATAPVLATNENAEMQPAGGPLATAPEIETHPWVKAPASKGMLGQRGHEFKPRQS